MRKTANNLKVLRGTDQPCRMNPDEIDFPTLSQVPDCPDYINVYGSQYWNRIIPVLQAKKVLTEADLEALEILCLLYGKIRKAASAEVDLNASMITQMRLYQTEFGLTPASRGKIKAGGEEGKANKFSSNGRKNNENQK